MRKAAIKQRWGRTAVLLLVWAIFGAAFADSDDHHQREYDEPVPPPVHKAWMRWIPDNVSLFALSIPFTHDSITYTAPSGGLCETQWMNLEEQLNSGIRGFDVRASRSKDPDRLEIWHGGCKLYRTLNDVLRTMKAFLVTNPTETLILVLGDDGIGDGESDHDVGAKTMRELFELRRCDYKDYIWNPKATDPDNPHCAVPATNPSNTTFTDSDKITWLSPTMGEVRGKIVLLRESGWDTDYDHTELGLLFQQNNIFSRWDLNALCDDWEDTVYGAGAHIKAANAAGKDLALDPTAPRKGFTVAALDAVSSACYPYSVSEWINREFYRFLVGYSDMENDADQVLGSFTGKSTGVVSMDFPGPGLIDAVIAHNLYLVTDPAKVGSEFDKLFENTWYAIEEDRPDDDDSGDDARDRWEAFRDFWKRVIPNFPYQLSVMRMDGHLVARVTEVAAYPGYAGELQDDWHVFFYTDTNPKPAAPTQAQLQAHVDSFPWTAMSSYARARAMRDHVNAKWPALDWTVVAYLHTPFGFENFAVGGSAGVHALSKNINDTRYYVSGIQKPPPPQVIADAGGPYLGTEGNGGVILRPGPKLSSGGASTLEWRWDTDGDGSWDTDFGNAYLAFSKPDDYSGTVRLEASNGFTTHVDETTVTIVNRAPTLYPTSGSSLVFEGDQVTINGTIADLGPDSMTVHFDWNADGITDTSTPLPQSSDKCSFSPSEYCTTFTQNYIYADNRPGALGETDVRIIAEDDDGGTSVHWHKLYVQNKAPSAGIPSLIKVIGGAEIAVNEEILTGTEVQVSVTWSDVPADLHSARIEWGDGAITPFGNLNSSPLVGTHTYTTTGPRQVLVVIKDDENAFTYRSTVPFSVGTPPPPPPDAPTADGGGPYSAPEGSPVVLDGSASTVDASLTAQYRWDFDGDGTWDTERSLNPISPPWLGPDPARPNDFSTDVARLEVFDGITAVIDATIEIDIVNVAPTVKTTVNDVVEGDLAIITVEITDPGWDYHDINVDYNNDGFWDEFQKTLAPGETQAVYRHVFDDEPYLSDTYAVEVWGFDRKAGGVLALTPTTVLNAAPTARINSVTAREVDRVTPLPPDTEPYYVVNTPLTLNGQWSDAGINDLQTITIDWGDGSETVFSGVAYPNTAIVAQHTYDSVGDRHIVLSVKDNDGGESPQHSWPVTVVNRPDETETILSNGFEE